MTQDLNCKLARSAALAGSVILFPLAGSAPAQSPWNTEFEGRVIATDAAPNTAFGGAVDVSGTTAVIGASGDDQRGQNAGAAYVFELDGVLWSQSQRLEAADAMPGDFFGSRATIYRNTLVIGVPNDSIGGLQRAGSVHIYRRAATGGSWMLEAQLTAPTPGPLERFGGALDLHDNTLAIGAWGDDDNGPFAGAVYVFERDDTTWSLSQKLIAFDGDERDLFGQALALIDDQLLIGAPRDIGDPLPGKCYLYARTGGDFGFDRIFSPAPGGGLFGHAVVLSSAGDRMAIGAPFNAGVSGEVFVYAFDGAGWNLEELLTASPGTSWFGRRLALDGDALVSGVFTGSIDVFRHTTSGWLRSTVDVQSPDLLIDPDVALFGGKVMVGHEGDSEAGQIAGAVHVFGLYDFAVPHCFGIGCPCGNDDPAAGCVNSTGSGALLRVLGANSISAPNLQLLVEGAPANDTGLFVSGDQDPVLPLAVGDGLVCVGGNSFRYLPRTVTFDGFLIHTAPLQATPPELLSPGATRSFQAWTRDVTCGPPPSPCPTPCGNGSNLSNAVRVTLAP